MVNYKTDYKIGDKVRILDVDKISGGYEFWNTGDETVVEELLSNGWIKLKPTIAVVDVTGNFIVPKEFKYIELVEEENSLVNYLLKLENKVISLEKRIQLLESELNKEKIIKTNIQAVVSDRLDSKALVFKIIETLSKRNKEEVKLSNNELRKKIIKEAKQFVEEHEPYTFKTIIKETGELEYKKIKLVDYKVDLNNKTVTCERFYQGSTNTNKTVAKCLDTDVFNVHIGKAIALGRLKGLDVSKFEDAVQPDKVVIGMEVLMNYTDQTRVIKKIESNSKLFFTNGNRDMIKNVVSILDDSNAKY